MEQGHCGPDWIEDGEKFALKGLDVELAADVSRADLAGGLTVLPNAEFALPNQWQEWLGNLRVEDIGTCRLFLLAKIASASPGVLDGENQQLERAVGDWFTGLTLVRKFGAIDPPLASIVRDEAPISADDLRRVLSVTQGVALLRQPGGVNLWRLGRCVALYREARCEREVLERIHQFARCIEGLIASKQGETGRQFKSRTELFIGPRRHDLMGELYEVRSAVEHLHEHRYLEDFDRQVDLPGFSGEAFTL